MAEVTAGAAGFEFVIEETFDCDRATMFELWTQEDHLVQWFGPKGCELTTHGNDLRPGGMMLYRMEMGGEVHWGRWIYREISPPEKLEFIVSFSDEAGGVTRNPWYEHWPLQTYSTVTFEDRDGRCHVKVHWQAYEATEEELRTFEEGQESMAQGWGGTYEKLRDYVAFLKE